MADGSGVPGCWLLRHWLLSQRVVSHWLVSPWFQGLWLQGLWLEGLWLLRQRLLSHWLVSPCFPGLWHLAGGRAAGSVDPGSPSPWLRATSSGLLAPGQRQRAAGALGHWLLSGGPRLPRLLEAQGCPGAWRRKTASAPRAGQRTLTDCPSFRPRSPGRWSGRRGPWPVGGTGGRDGVGRRFPPG